MALTLQEAHDLVKTITFTGGPSFLRLRVEPTQVDAYASPVVIEPTHLKVRTSIRVPSRDEKNNNMRIPLLGWWVEWPVDGLTITNTQCFDRGIWSDRETLLKKVRKQAWELLKHELDEGFIVDGVREFDPHRSDT